MSPKPAVSAWIASERKRLGWKSEELARRMRAAGYEVADTTVRTWEAGRRPSQENLEALERLFSSRVPAEPQPTGDISALVAALTAQTEAINGLVRELAAARQETADLRERVGKAEEYAASHERLFQADRVRLGLGPVEGERSESPLPAASR